jgi:peptidoglycan hydrolase-like protein with peptidoglycan-binding domain
MEALVKAFVMATIAASILAASTGFRATAQVVRSPQQTAAVDAGELNMEALPPLNEDGIRRVQEALRNKGFDSGPVDGIFGPRTEQAVHDFQDRYGIRASGKVDNQTLYALGEATLAGPPADQAQSSSR